MQLIMMGDLFEQELKPLVKSFYQNENLETEIEDFDEELTWPEVREGRLFYTVSQDKYIPFDYEIEKGLVVHLGKKHFHVAYFEDNLVKDFTEEETNPERKAYRNQLARAVYRLLSKASGRTLPWGILTGVRPTKLVYEQLEEGHSEKDIRQHMKEEYYCADEKAEVSLQVAGRERELLSAFPYADQYSLYIGIPFCPTTCHYCSFTSFPLAGFGHLVEPYLNALTKEIEAGSKLFPDKKISTVYFGGGTPTTLSAEQLVYLIRKVRESFDLSECREFTVEAGRPDSITREKLIALKECGINRISINPQSMNDKTLEAIGRRHTAAEIISAFHLARECGHDNINMDIILGLTGEKPEDVEETLRQIAELQPDSLTVHTLALKRAARMNIEHQKFRDIGAKDVPEMLSLTREFAKKQEYQPYYLYRQKNMSENLENVGYARRGKESLYNILIMEEKQTILALGAGASTKFVYWQQPMQEGIRIERVENVKNVNHYIERIDEMIERKTGFLKENGDGL